MPKSMNCSLEPWKAAVRQWERMVFETTVYLFIRYAKKFLFLVLILLASAFLCILVHKVSYLVYNEESITHSKRSHFKKAIFK